MLPTLLLAAVIAAGSAEPARVAGPAEYPIFLSDGRVLQSMRRPVVAFGGVMLVDVAGRSIWLSANDVDLERSAEVWNRGWCADTLAKLDKNPVQGKPWPTFAGVTESGAELLVGAGGESPYTLVVIWSTYCMKCHHQIAQEKAWRDREHLT